MTRNFQDDSHSTKFFHILIPANRIEGFEQVEQVTGYKPATYEFRDRVYFHVGSVHKLSEMQRILAAMTAIWPGTLGDIWGDEPVYSVPKGEIKPGRQPARRIGAHPEPV